jgi:UDPglucose--hexose-1-phosphate uridylyltransferase
MAKAPVEEPFPLAGFKDIQAGIVRWPMSVIRLDSENREELVSAADHILTVWRTYTDKDAFIFAETDGEMHNTITPIARMNGKKFELDLVLRNNITTPEHPLGVYHPHAELHHIKKENIGLIEVMGLAVLPSRLKKELELLGEAIINRKDIAADETLEKHADWVKEFLPRYSNVNKDTVTGILQQETGIVFSRVLEHAGVYKRTERGRAAFRRFIASL